MRKTKPGEISIQEMERFIRDDSDVKLWLSKFGSRYTRMRYGKNFMVYVKWADMTPAELLSLKHNQTNHDAERKLDLFVVDMLEKGKSKYSLQNIVNAVKSFYKYNYEDLAAKCGRVQVAKKKPYRTPTQNSLNEFMKQANLRDKALITFLASAPVREGTLCRLKWRHVWKELIEDPVDTPHIIITAKELKGQGYEKYKDLQQHCFLIPQAKEKLLQYKTWREKREGRTLTPEDPLFATLQKKNGSKPLFEALIRKIFQRRSQKTGITLSPHDLRRFVQTQLEQARMPQNWVKTILGHKVSGEEAAYSQPKIEQLRKAFKKAIPHLTIQPTEIIKTAELQKLQQQIEDMQKENVKLKEGLNATMLSGDQVQELLRRIEKLEKLAQKQN